jgi:hypothetical protein
MKRQKQGKELGHLRSAAAALKADTAESRGGLLWSCAAVPSDGRNRASRKRKSWGVACWTEII